MVRLLFKGRLGWKGLKQSEYVENGYAYLIANKHINNGYINWKSADQKSSPDSCVKCYTMFLPFLLIKIDVFS